MIAALYVEAGGCYFGLPDVDPWPLGRDACTYAGPWPVVAHPPCERWGNFATWHGGTVGADAGCFEAALAAVHRWGGVLEHPAGSRAWRHFGLPVPASGTGWRGDLFGAHVCAVEQGHYGHPARKATWLYYVGPPPPDLIRGPAPQRLPARRLAERGYASAMRCGMCSNLNSKARQRTPPAFRDALLALVRGAAMQDAA